MKQPVFTVEDLMNLTVYDLFGNSELEGIGKTTLSSGISAFKKKYLKIQYDEEATAAEESLSEPEAEELVLDEEAFEDVIINTIEKEGKKERNKKKQKTDETIDEAPKPVANKTLKPTGPAGEACRK